ncbi:MAG: SRPBCC family protein [Cellvibrionaceae bacterium]
MTAELTAEGVIELTIEKEFAYSPEQVFDAWLKPDQLMQWMGPTDEINVSSVEVNPIEGGSYHMEFNATDGEANKLNGVYKTIQRYTTLIFTWIWEPPTDGANEETLVTLNFEPTQKGTKLTLLHQRFPSEELRDRHNWGWTETLEKFERRAALLFDK